MSVTLMSAVFSHDMQNLVTDTGRKVPDSTAKFVLLALADCANDRGESAYPSIDTLMKKVSMARATVVSALNALRHAGYIEKAGESKYHTTSYIIKVQQLNCAEVSKFNSCTLQSSTIEHESSVKQLNIKEKQNQKDAIIEAMENCGMFPNSNTLQFISSWKQTHSEEWIIKAIALSKGKTQNYVDKVLLGWEANGYPKTREQQVAERRAGETKPMKKEMPVYVPD